MKITSYTPISYFWSLFPVIIWVFCIFLSSETVPEAVNTQSIVILDYWVCWVSHSWVVLLINFSPHFLPSHYPSLHLSNPSQKSPDSTPFPFFFYTVDTYSWLLQTSQKINGAHTDLRILGDVTHLLAPAERFIGSNLSHSDLIW